MTAREQALYQLGHELGVAHGLEQCVATFEQAFDQVREWPAFVLVQASVKRAHGLLKAYGDREMITESLADVLFHMPIDRGELANWLGQLAQQSRGAAQQHRSAFVEGLARVPAMQARQGSTLARRLLRRVVAGLHEALND